MTAGLTTTSYAILGLLAIKPWSSYELTKQMRRTVGQVWPRAESGLYREPQRLVAAGLATTDHQTVGKRPRTEYAITEAGRTILQEWLERPAAPTLIESEALVKVLFGNGVDPAVLAGQLEAFGREGEALAGPWRAIARDYVDGGGTFPERLHVNALFWVLLDRWAQLRSDWAAWAAEQVRTWPDSAGPRDRAAVRRLLEQALADRSELPR
jgi:PadR family transcriptional regulator, regulatory protein AphA